jgi:cytochrome c551
VQVNRRIAAAAVAAALALAACGGSGGGSGAEPVDVDAIDLSDAGAAGRDLFAEKCSACHKGDLTGGAGPALGPGSASAGKSLEQIQATIQRGAGGMPAWAGILTDRQIADLTAFLSEAQGR